MNKKGFTLVEVIVSVVLVSIVLSFMLASLVKIKQTYNTVYEEADGDIYSSSLARIINNDINENGGIKYYNCETDGNTCEFTLGNNQKRIIEIYDTDNSSIFVGNAKIQSTTVDGYVNYEFQTDGNFENNMFCEAAPYCSTNNKSQCKCRVNKESRTLRYINSTDKNNQKNIYIKTLNLKKTKYDDENLNLSTVGYTFGSMYTDFITYQDPNNSNYENKISTITIKVYDGIDKNDTTHDIIISSSARYKKEKVKYGDDITITLNPIQNNGTYIAPDNSDSSYVAYIIETYGKGFYLNYTETNSEGQQVVKTKKIDKIDGLPTATGHTFDGYYYYEDGNEIQVIDSAGTILVNNTFFKDKSGIVLKAKWD